MLKEINIGPIYNSDHLTANAELDVTQDSFVHLTGIADWEVSGYASYGLSFHVDRPMTIEFHVLSATLTRGGDAVRIWD